MAVRYHISPGAGPKRCRATVAECPLGGEHFSSMAEAAKAYEKELAAESGAVMTVTRKAAARTRRKGVFTPELFELNEKLESMEPGKVVRFAASGPRARQAIARVVAIREEMSGEYRRKASLLEPGTGTHLVTAKTYERLMAENEQFDKDTEHMRLACRIAEGDGKA